MSRDPVHAEELSLLLMRAGSAVAERINGAVVAAGHPGLRPVHGLVFARISGTGASVNRIAEHLGITKQSASAIVDTLVRNGYVHRRPDPTDRRASIIELTDQGRQVTLAASRAAAAEVARLEGSWGPDALHSFTEMLDDLAAEAGPRPVW
ncbi:MarR family transcriptional regulator [Gordonia pseudamarae]|jgi:DNA-binding MarR family transcriptional regulator|uniref:MarR family transcriptional regulator n=1 Tax=Gordonia pseudamarae TaxID=2831662 RepID=A0ABX6IEG0_9ACTN|nr:MULTISPECIES: MarR family transcriptional regulator [Gordonia]MBD0022857.1 MarR family transcriptional regulator [Gordonia sp. (in: high G+C Gram-positive bacteria)]QHN24724.1 MarR family transcriptional regulator [Gordonia pseudamarae]QHN33655.1 MarR family transcriptional regulator [Gordonia pseudamarae]